MYLLLFLGLAAGGAGVLVGQGIHRTREEPEIRWRILAAAATALALWAWASSFMFLVTFGTVMSVAHLEPLPAGMFPEGWFVYGWLVAYALLGTALAGALWKFPKKQPPGILRPDVACGSIRACRADAR